MQLQYGVLDAIAMRAPCDLLLNAEGLSAGFGFQIVLQLSRFCPLSVLYVAPGLSETSMQEATTLAQQQHGG